MLAQPGVSSIGSIRSWRIWYPTRRRRRYLGGSKCPTLFAELLNPMASHWSIRWRPALAPANFSQPASPIRVFLDRSFHTGIMKGRNRRHGAGTVFFAQASAIPVNSACRSNCNAPGDWSKNCRHFCPLPITSEVPTLLRMPTLQRLQPGCHWSA